MGRLQRSAGKADSEMANVGECLAIAGQITPGDGDSWYRVWSGFGARLVSQAREAAGAGHRVSARGAYLRAAEYFWQAFFVHRDDAIFKPNQPKATARNTVGAAPSVPRTRIRRQNTSGPSGNPRK